MRRRARRRGGTRTSGSPNARHCRNGRRTDDSNAVVGRSSTFGSSGGTGALRATEPPRSAFLGSRLSLPRPPAARAQILAAHSEQRARRPIRVVLSDAPRIVSRGSIPASPRADDSPARRRPGHGTAHHPRQTRGSPLHRTSSWPKTPLTCVARTARIVHGPRFRMAAVENPTRARGRQVSSGLKPWFGLRTHRCARTRHCSEKRPRAPATQRNAR